MKQAIGILQLVGFSLTALVGTLLHFLYDWLGRPVWIAPFCGVNESTFEHMKLLFWPMLLYSLIERLFISERGDFFAVKLRGTLLGIALIPILFYTYNGVIGKSPDWVNIAIFFIAAAAAFFYEYRLFNANNATYSLQNYAPIAIIAAAALFILFTFFPPGLALFSEPRA